MLKNLSNTQLSVCGLVILLVIEFFSNAWIGFGESRKSLALEPWDKSVLNKPPTLVLSPVNDVFGLKPEPDPVAEEQRRLDAEAEAARLAREMKERKQQEVIAIGADNIRLFGISIYGGSDVALIKIDGAEGDKLLSLQRGEVFELQQGKVSITIDEVLTSEILLTIANKTNNESNSFNLVIFNYGL